MNLTFIKNYVDDLCMTTNENNINEVFLTLNSINNQIQFTLKKEKFQSIPFLDIELIRYGTNVVTT